MAGGLDRRMQREHLRALKLQNAERAMQMTSPQQLLEQAGLMQTITGQALQNQQIPQEMAMRQQGMGAANINAMTGLFNTLSSYRDVSGPLIEYLKTLGVTGDFPQAVVGPMQQPRVPVEQALAQLKNRGNE